MVTHLTDIRAIFGVDLLKSFWGQMEILRTNLTLSWWATWFSIILRCVRIFFLCQFRFNSACSFCQHGALLRTAELCLATPSSSNAMHQSNGLPCVLVFYTHHRPHLANKDMQFFTKAREQGWNCEEIVTERFEVSETVSHSLFWLILWCHFKPMFPEDPGDEAVRAVVHGWCLTRI